MPGLTGYPITTHIQSVGARFSDFSHPRFRFWGRSTRIPDFRTTVSCFGHFVTRWFRDHNGRGADFFLSYYQSKLSAKSPAADGAGDSIQGFSHQCVTCRPAVSPPAETSSRRRRVSCRGPSGRRRGDRRCRPR